MRIGRRGFLGLLAAGTVGAALAPLPVPAAVPVQLVTDGWQEPQAEYWLRQGDVFTIAGMFALNPLTMEPTGRLQQFVATAEPSAGSTT